MKKSLAQEVCQKSDKVKRPLLARVFNNLTEITCVKNRVVEFFLTEAVNTVVGCGAIDLMYTVTVLLEKK